MVCVGSASFTSPYSGLTLWIGIAYTTQSSSCQPPSYCASTSSNGWMIASVSLPGPDWEYEGVPSGNAFSLIFGNCSTVDFITTKTNPNKN